MPSLFGIEFAVEDDNVVKVDKIAIFMKNPFHSQGPSDPRYYANRKELLAFFKENVLSVKESRGVTKPQNISIMGRWGIGKTSTLYKFKDILANECDGARVFSSIIQLKPANCIDSDTFTATVLETMFRDYSTTVKLPAKLSDFIKEQLKDIENWRITRFSPTNIEIERKQKPVNAVNFKEALSKFWQKLKANQFDLAVIMIDDIHYCLQENAGLLFDLRTDMQGLSADGARYSFVITGPATLYPEMRDKAEPFTRLFEKNNLEPFDVEGTSELIEKPLKAEGIELTISREAISHIQEITEGHPYFITLIMRDLLTKKQSGEVTLQEFKKFYPDLIAHFAKVKFDDDFNRATDAEKDVLLKMAGSKKPIVTLTDAGGRGKAKMMERLVQKDLVIKEGRGKYKLYNNLFKEYLRKKL